MLTWPFSEVDTKKGLNMQVLCYRKHLGENIGRLLEKAREPSDWDASLIPSEGERKGRFAGWTVCAVYGRFGEGNGESLSQVCHQKGLCFPEASLPLFPATLIYGKYTLDANASIVFRTQSGCMSVLSYL